MRVENRSPFFLDTVYAYMFTFWKTPMEFLFLNLLKGAQAIQPANLSFSYNYVWRIILNYLKSPFYCNYMLLLKLSANLSTTLLLEARYL